MSIKKVFIMLAVFVSVLVSVTYAGDSFVSQRQLSQNENNSSTQQPGDTANYVLMCFTNMSKPECQVLAYRSCTDVMSNLDQSLIDEYGITCSDVM